MNSGGGRHNANIFIPGRGKGSGKSRFRASAPPLSVRITPEERAKWKEWKKQEKNNPADKANIPILNVVGEDQREKIRAVLEENFQDAQENKEISEADPKSSNIHEIVKHLELIGFSTYMINMAISKIGHNKNIEDYTDWLVLNIGDDLPWIKTEKEKSKIQGVIDFSAQSKEDVADARGRLALKERMFNNFGFDATKVEKTLKEFDYDEAKTVDKLFKKMFKTTGRLKKGASHEITKEIRQELMDEVNVLRKIFGDDFQQRNGFLYLPLSTEEVEFELKKKHSSSVVKIGKSTLVIRFPSFMKYPFQIPILFVENDALPMDCKKHIILDMCGRADKYCQFKEPFIFKLKSEIEETFQDTIDLCLKSVGDVKRKKKKPQKTKKPERVQSIPMKIILAKEAEERKQEEVDKEHKRKRVELMKKLMAEDEKTAGQTSASDHPPPRSNGVEKRQNQKSKQKTKKNKKAGDLGVKPSISSKQDLSGDDGKNPPRRTGSRHAGDGGGGAPTHEVDEKTAPRRRLYPYVKSAEEMADDSFHMYNYYRYREQNDWRYNQMLENRMKLPTCEQREDIISIIDKHQVVVLSGQTGCGKTTQVPQLILDDMIVKQRGGFANIVVTQPRRISAVSVATRVCDERNERLGGTIGYQIRLDTKKSRDTKVMFCTTGILLRRLGTDKLLQGVTHVVVDEVHERSADSDFLLIILRHILKERKDLKVVLMSATIDSIKFRKYFGSLAEVPLIEIKGTLFNVYERFIHDAVIDSRYTVSKTTNRRYLRKTKKIRGYRGGHYRDQLGFDEGQDDQHVNPYRHPEEEEKLQRMIHFKFTQEHHPEFTYDELRELFDTYDRLDEKVINMELIESLILSLVKEHQHAGILVFLPGIMEIKNLYTALNQPGSSLNMTVLPLHSSISIEEQSRVFIKPEPGFTKVILATNIAETSITIDDITCVIDSGKMKETRFDTGKAMDSLVETWISKAGAKQRAGRAGRVREGICYHLFKERTYKNKLADYQQPEILRIPLEELCLRMSMLDFGTIRSLLSSAIDAPKPAAISHAMELLRKIQAVEETSEYMTPLGQNLSKLPVSVRIGKMLIYACIFECVDPILTIAASMSFRSPFVTPWDKRDEADKAKRRFVTGEDSDHLVILNAYNTWFKFQRHHNGRAVKQFCTKNFLSLHTLHMIRELKEHLFALLQDAKFVKEEEHGNPNRKYKYHMHIKENKNAENKNLVRAILCSGLYPNIALARELKAKKQPQPGERKRKALFEFTTINKNIVQLHPSSSVGGNLSGLVSNFVAYQELVRTNNSYIRHATCISPFSLLLFGGKIGVQHQSQIVSIDNWISFQVDLKEAVLLKQLRKKLVETLKLKIEYPDKEFERGDQVFRTVTGLLHSENFRSGEKIVGGIDNDPLNGL